MSIDRAWRAGSAVWRAGALAGGALATWGLLVPLTVQAHPFPAEPPAFDSDACIEVVDKREQDSWHLDYRVPFEDTVADPDKIALPDTKTHQFLAVAGHVRAEAMGHVFVPLGESEPLPMPTWLTLDDVQRADAAVDEALVDWRADMLSEAEIAENDPVLWSRLTPFMGEPRRVPITQEQGMQGMDWDLAEVPVGVYQIVAHIFSPPYNGWRPRPGLLKVIDGSADPVVVTVRPVGANLFARQGRRLTGCVEAPAGSTIQIAARNRGEVDSAFETWLAEQPIEDGEYDVCLQNPGINGTLEVRVDVQTPEGEVVSAYAEEVIALFEGSAPCLESETKCCPPSENDAGGRTLDGGAQAEAGREMPSPRQADDASTAREDSDGGHHDAGAVEAMDGGAPHESAGCGIAGGREPKAGLGALLAVLALCFWALARRVAGSGRAQ